MSKTEFAPKNFKFSGSIYRLLAIVLTALSILVLFLPINAVNGKGFTYDFFTLFTSSASGMIGFASTLMRFAFVFLMIATAALAIYAIVKPEAEQSYVFTATLLFLVGCGGYTLSVISCGLAMEAFEIDIASLVFAIFALAAYCYLSYTRAIENFFESLLQFSLTLAYSILACLSLGSLLNNSGFIGVLVILLTALVIANFCFECIRLQNEGNLMIDRTRFLGEVGAAAVLFILTLIAKESSISGILFALLAIGFALGQVELVGRKIRSDRRKDRYRRPMMAERENEDAFAPADAMPVPPFARPMPMPSPIAASVTPTADLNGFHVEEYAEACPYEGGPINGVQMAEEVNPTFTPNPTPAEGVPGQVYTAGYDFYNSKSFDPFIATLDTEERNQFTELFILKYKGVMPEIPDYEVGGDNKEFFRKIFIYLGQYRDRIPSGLLAKIYNFSVKIS